MVPCVTAWVTPVTQLKEILAAMESNHGRFLNSVFGCLLAQALPEREPIPKAVRFPLNLKVARIVFRWQRLVKGKS